MNPRHKSFSFYRRYHGYTGGHQKVRDYIDHTLAYGNSQVNLWEESRSPIHPEMFRNIAGVHYAEEYRPNLSDVVFLAGMDWQNYLPRMDLHRPKINLVQHVRHGDPDHPLFAFLKHRAIRLCVSDAVRDAILPHANGPCLTIRMGHCMPEITYEREFELYILANKQPELGRKLANWAQSKQLKVKLHDEYVEKSAVYEAMAKSHVTVALPNKTEGFYLPGIEAMKLSTWAVIPDCIASREYTKDKHNIFGCAHDEEAIKSAITKALFHVPKWSTRLSQWRGRKLAESYTLKAEREAYHQILDQLDNIWSKP